VYYHLGQCEFNVYYYWLEWKRRTTTNDHDDPFPCADSEAHLPLMRKDINETVDSSRTATSKTIVVPGTPGNLTEEKSKFSIREFSGTQNEDLIALVVMINPFRASWAESRSLCGMPQLPVT
jgi:hypothetical protein